MSIKPLNHGPNTITAAFTTSSIQPLNQLGSTPFDLRNILQTNDLLSEQVSKRLTEKRSCLPHLTSSSKEKAALLTAAEVVIKKNPIKQTVVIQFSKPGSMSSIYKPENPSELQRLDNIKNACLTAAPSCKTKSFFQKFQFDLEQIHKATKENRPIEVSETPIKQNFFDKFF